jgi:hypothetical protein
MKNLKKRKHPKFRTQPMIRMRSEMGSTEILILIQIHGLTKRIVGMMRI